MELVHGVPITEYCDKNKLSTQQRLELFIPVCQAIQHAHQKGIIHRDIKPSNVMVTLHDGVPVPRVIDFGIAKAINQRLTEKTLFTNYAQMIGTPAYMSPEQAEMSGLDIDTRSDVYSLGVLMYELLTGSTPFDAKELLSRGYAEMQRIISEQEPVKPSTRMSTLSEEQRTVVAKNRSVEPAALGRVLRGDLDWIVMRCLEKDRTRRYETSNGLAADLRRYLNNELITARAPTTGYLLKKLIKRNKLAVGAASAVVGAMVIGALVATWQAVRATRAEHLATERLAESEAITKFLTGVFQSPDPAKDGRTITVAETLDKAVKNLDSELANQPARRAQLQSVLGSTYLSLGLPRDAIPLQEKARDYYLATLGLENPETLHAMGNLALSLSRAGIRLDEALRLREETLRQIRKVQGPEHDDTIRAMGNLAQSYSLASRHEEALRLEEEVLALSRRMHGFEHLLTLSAMNNLAFSYLRFERIEEALRLLEQSKTLCREKLGPKDPLTLITSQSLAFAWFEAGRREEAIQLEEQLLPLFQEVFGPEHSQTLGMMGNLATIYFGELHLYFGESQEEKARKRRQDFEKALKMREALLALNEKVHGLKHEDTFNAIARLGDSYWAAGLHEKAIEKKEQLWALQSEMLGPERQETLGTLLNLAYCYREDGQVAKAISQGESVLKMYTRALGPTNRFTLNAMTELSVSYGADHRLDEAIALEEKALQLKRQHLPPGHGWALESLLHLATCYEEAKRPADAEPLRREFAELKAKAEAKQRGSGVTPQAPANR